MILTDIALSKKGANLSLALDATSEYAPVPRFYFQAVHEESWFLTRYE